MLKLELTSKEGTILVKVLVTKAKEIHAWRCATGSRVRDEEYDEVATLLKRVTFISGGV